MSLSEFQNHLSRRIIDHAERIGFFKLGSAAFIRHELEDRLAQVWVLIRNDDKVAATSVPLSPWRPSRDHSILAGRMGQPNYVSTTGPPEPTSLMRQLELLSTAKQTECTSPTEQPEPVVTKEQPEPLGPTEQPQSVVAKEQAKSVDTTERTKPASPTEEPNPVISKAQPEPLGTTEQTKPASVAGQTNPVVAIKQPEPLGVTEQTNTANATRQTKPTITIGQPALIRRMRLKQPVRPKVNIAQSIVFGALPSSEYPIHPIAKVSQLYIVPHANNKLVRSSLHRLTFLPLLANIH
jgi:hypothetical protein